MPQDSAGLGGGREEISVILNRCIIYKVCQETWAGLVCELLLQLLVLPGSIGGIVAPIYPRLGCRRRTTLSILRFFQCWQKWILICLPDCRQSPPLTWWDKSSVLLYWTRSTDKMVCEFWFLLSRSFQTKKRVISIGVASNIVFGVGRANRKLSISRSKLDFFFRRVSVWIFH